MTSIYPSMHVSVKMGVSTFVASLSFPVCAGKMKGLAFIKDPDGYWIEVLNPNAKV